MNGIIALVGVLTLAAPAQTSENGWSFPLNDWTLRVAPSGQTTSLKNAAGVELCTGPTEAPPFVLEVWDGDTLTGKVSPTRSSFATPTDSGVTLDYDLAPEWPLHVQCQIDFVAVAGSPVLRRVVTLTPQGGPFSHRTVLRMKANAQPSGPDVRVFIPRQDGMGTLERLGQSLRTAWTLAANPFPKDEPCERLAIPCLSMASPDNSVRVTHVADPFWSMGFSETQDSGGKNAGSAEYVMVNDLPIDAPFTRTFWTAIHNGGPEEAMKVWYATALADVPPGPDWLHDIAWQHYDYLSHGGKGWFEDLDAVERYVAREDRPKTIFALHGWYDVLGRYTFDAEKGRLDDSWTAFPNAPAVKEKGFPTSESVPMTKAEMHRRIRYAKDRGVRVALYFADGMTACEGAGRFTEDRVLFWGGWNGPDTIGKAYAQNPLVPDVYKWYVDYLKALLAEYGQEIDALVWDETFMVRAASTSPENAGPKQYVAPAMMRLVRELTRTTTAYRKDLAFLTSDCIGATGDEKTRWLDVPPYAIMAHGTYQDSHSRPSVWPYGIFPNFRNVLWSCNWSAVTKFDWTKLGVERYDTPVATSNGWLDDKGIAHLTDDERNQVLTLFNARKTRRQELKWLANPAS